MQFRLSFPRCFYGPFAAPKAAPPAEKRPSKYPERHRRRFELCLPQPLPAAAGRRASRCIFTFIFIFIPIFNLYAVRELGFEPVLLGLVISMVGVGFLVSALTAKRLTSRFGLGPTMVGGALVTAIAVFMMPLQGNTKAATVAILMVGAFSAGPRHPDLRDKPYEPTAVDHSGPPAGENERELQICERLHDDARLADGGSFRRNDWAARHADGRGGRDAPSVFEAAAFAHKRAAGPTARDRVRICPRNTQKRKKKEKNRNHRYTQINADNRNERTEWSSRQFLRLVFPPIAYL